MSKVFDTVDYAILVQKLENYGGEIANLAWLRIYLTNREPYIQIKNDSKINMRNITSGVQ